MDEKSLPDLLSQLIPGEAQEEAAAAEEESAEEQNNALAESLKAAAGQSGGPFETAVDEFLRGKGVLHEAAKAARQREGGSAVDEVVHVLTTQFDLSPTVATVIGMLLVKLVPSIGKKPKKASSGKKKTRSETKPKAKAKTKPKAKVEKGSEKKAKKKTATKPKTAAKPAAKKKATSKTVKKKTASAEKRKKAK